MFKHLVKRLVQIRLTTCLLAVLALVVVIRLFTCYGYFDFPHIPVEEIPNQLHREVSPNLLIKPNLPACTYDQILTSTNTLKPWEVPKKFDDFLPTGIANGSYVPEHCNPAFSVAILVTYRNRQKQLDVFMPYMHNFLRKQNIHYKIFLIEQQDDGPWNKGVLYNVGARHAIAERFPCLVLHDVDMLPLDDSNLYVCTKQPRHMSGSLDKFRWVLLYETLVGGVLAMRTEHFVAVNGLSNRFHGWGGEDDDLANRIHAHTLTIQRFPRNMSRYTMVPHEPAARNKERLRIMAENSRRPAADGLATLAYSSLHVSHARLFTWLRVRL